VAPCLCSLSLMPLYPSPSLTNKHIQLSAISLLALSAHSLDTLFLSLSLLISFVSPAKVFLTLFSLMLAPFRSRISTTSPFPLRAA
jgi:hypothetical protein